MKTDRPIGQEDPMMTFCRMVTETSYDDFPQEVIQFAKDAIQDVIALMIGGSAMEGIPNVIDYVKENGGKPESYIILHGGKVPASEAGLAMAPMSRAMDLGDCHPEALHSTEYLVPALFAATGMKNKVSGRDLITAYILGEEVMLRIGKAFKPVSEGIPRGMTAGYYIFGVIAAVARLMGLTREQLERAEGIGRQMTQPHDTAQLQPITHMVKVHQGFIAQDAINCCLLAREGINSPREILVGPRAYLSFPKWQTDPSALTEKLGEDWEFLNVGMKKFAGCYGGHTSMFGIMDQMKTHRFTPDDIEKIHFNLSAVSWQLTANPWEAKMDPQTSFACQFSLPYLVATAAYDQDVFLTSFTPEARSRMFIQDLMKRMTGERDANLPPWGSRMMITLKDGRNFSKEYFYTDLPGTRNKRFTEKELQARFKRCVPYSSYTLNEKTVDSLIQKLRRLEQVDDVVKDVILPLTPK